MNCYLGDKLNASDGCETAVNARVRISWVRFSKDFCTKNINTNNNNNNNDTSHHLQIHYTTLLCNTCVQSILVVIQISY